jgi:hypothetical protein
VRRSLGCSLLPAPDHREDFRPFVGSDSLPHHDPRVTSSGELEQLEIVVCDEGDSAKSRVIPRLIPVKKRGTRRGELVATTVETVRVQASRGRSLPHPVRPRPSRHRAVPADRGWMRHALAKERSWGPISGRTAMSPGPSSAPFSDPLGPDPTCTRESPVEDLWWRLVGERLCLPSASATSPRNSGCCRGLDQRLLRKVQAERQAPDQPHRGCSRQSR